MGDANAAGAVKANGAGGRLGAVDVVAPVVPAAAPAATARSPALLSTSISSCTSISGDGDHIIVNVA